MYVIGHSQKRVASTKGVINNWQFPDLNFEGNIKYNLTPFCKATFFSTIGSCGFIIFIYKQSINNNICKRYASFATVKPGRQELVVPFLLVYSVFFAATTLNSLVSFFNSSHSVQYTLVTPLKLLRDRGPINLSVKLYRNPLQFKGLSVSTHGFSRDAVASSFIFIFIFIAV